MEQKIMRSVPFILFAIMTIAGVLMWATAVNAATAQVPIGLVAQGAGPESFPSLDVVGWANIITSTGFGGLVWFLMVRFIPQMQIRFDTRTDKSKLAWETRFKSNEAAWSARFENQAEAHKGDLDRILSAFEKKP